MSSLFRKKGLYALDRTFYPNAGLWSGLFALLIIIQCLLIGFTFYAYFSGLGIAKFTYDMQAGENTSVIINGEIYEFAHNDSMHYFACVQDDSGFIFCTDDAELIQLANSGRIQGYEASGMTQWIPDVFRSTLNHLNIYADNNFGDVYINTTIKAMSPFFFYGAMAEAAMAFVMVAALIVSGANDSRIYRTLENIEKLGSAIEQLDRELSSPYNTAIGERAVITEHFFVDKKKKRVIFLPAVLWCYELSCALSSKLYVHTNVKKYLLIQGRHRQSGCIADDTARILLRRINIPVVGYSKENRTKYRELCTQASASISKSELITSDEGSASGTVTG